MKLKRRGGKTGLKVVPLAKAKQSHLQEFKKNL